jgi:phosphatidyl-myo-inositol dimannoside synthase
MRILLTLDFPPEKGGIQTYLSGIVRHRYGCDDVVLVGATNDAISDRIEYPCTVKWVTFPFVAKKNKKWSLIPLAFFYLHLLIKYRHDDITIECGTIYCAMIPWFFSCIFSNPYNVYTYGTELIALQSKCLYSTIVKNFFFKANKLYVLGNYTIRLLKGIGITNNFEIEHPRISISASITKKKNRLQRKPIPLRAVRLLCVGRLVHHKGHQHLLQACALLPGSIRWRLCIVGDGPKLPDLLNLANTLAITPNVAFSGSLSDAELNDEYGYADLLVVPSLETSSGTEGFGIVILEAMAYRIPVIGSAIGGIPEVLCNGSCGRLVEPANCRVLAKAIIEVWTDRKTRIQYVRSAWNRVKQHYVWN